MKNTSNMYNVNALKTVIPRTKIFNLNSISFQKCIIDTSATVYLLIAFEFIKRIPANFKIFTHTHHISMTPIPTKK